MKIKLLRNEIESVSLAAMPIGDVRYYLCSLSVEVSESSGWVSVVATDSHRLHILQASGRILSKNIKDEKTLICIESVSEMIKAMKITNASGLILNTKKKTYETTDGETRIKGEFKIVDRGFVDWRGVINSQVKGETQISRIGVNIQYILDAQKAIKSFPSFNLGVSGKTGVEMQFHGSDSPIVVTHSELCDGLEVVNFHAIIMPLLSKYLTSPELKPELLK